MTVIGLFLGGVVTGFKTLPRDEVKRRVRVVYKAFLPCASQIYLNGRGYARLKSLKRWLVLVPGGATILVKIPLATYPLPTLAGGTPLPLGVVCKMRRARKKIPVERGLFLSTLDYSF